MFGLFKTQPLLEATSSRWLFHAFAWSLENFDADLFFNNTPLVLPTNEFFPGRVNNTPGMADLIFDQVKRYAAVSHWPTRVVDHSTCSLLESPRTVISGALRVPDGIVNMPVDDSHRLLIPYNPHQINDPEGMIATFAHVIAYYLAQTAREPPPGGADYWPQATELLGIYLGFGLMFANSAFTFRGGCGSCFNPHAVRDAHLSETESTYALAVFSVLKAIPDSTVTRYLKKHLRGFYRKAVKEISARVDELTPLKEFQSHSSLMDRAAQTAEQAEGT